MQNKSSSLCTWTWAIAAWLIVLLIWLALNGHGPNNGCCGSAAVEAAAPVAAPVTEPIAAAPAVEPFKFVGTGNDFNSTGDGSKLAWFANTEPLRAMLSGGSDLRAEGDDKHVVLTGIVDSEDIKTKKGEEAQAFFGPDVSVDNQIVVKAAEAPVAAVAPPPAAKLYFDSGKTALAADANTTLAPIVEWLKANSNSKAVISGFHDPRGNKAFNESLAKNRAKAVREALKTSGIDEARIEMRKPESVEGSGDLAEARRVEVSVENM